MSSLNQPLQYLLRPRMGLLLSLCCAWSLLIRGQDCRTENVTLITQAEVNSFQADHGPCTTVIGNLIIAGSDITNLDGLLSLNSVGGELRIQSNTILTNVDGLSSLNGVGARLIIFENNSLTNVDGLLSLNSVGGDLEIGNNDKLINVDGLSSLNSVGGRLSISSNDRLINVDGLSSLNSVGGNLNIAENIRLGNVDGLSSLNSVGGGVLINSNNRLENVDGLSSLNRVEGNLIISSNIRLFICCGLHPLLNGGTIGGTTTMSGNASSECNNNGNNISMVCTNRPPSTPFSTTVTGTQNRPFCFTLAHFPFLDVNPSTVLSAVDITTLPAVGTLFLDVNGNNSNDGGAESFTAGTDISVADINAGKLKYIQNGTPQSSFTFGVSDGMAFSAAPAGTITINLNPSIEGTDTKDHDLNATDPCSCEDPQNTTVGGVFLFHDILTVTSSPNRSIWLSVNDGEFRDANNQPLAAGALPTSNPGGNASGIGTGTLILETSTPGTYQLDFYHRENIAATISYTDGSTTKVFVSSSCAPCVVADPIPTMSQWGLLIFGLLVLNLGVFLLTKWDSVEG